MLSERKNTFLLKGNKILWVSWGSKVLISDYTSSSSNFLCFFVPSPGRGFLFLLLMNFPKSLWIGVLESYLIPHLACRSLQVEISLWETQ
jgi:hypothetical protein